MIGSKVKYTCKNCGWFTQVRAEWADLKPKRCMNKKCNTSFMKWPEALIVQVPEKPADQSEPGEVKTPSKRGKKREQTQDPEGQ